MVLRKLHGNWKLTHLRKYTDTTQWNVAIGGDAAETGVGPGSYDIRQSVWHVNVSQAS